MSVVEFSSTTPTAPAGKKNIVFQKNPAATPRPLISAYVDAERIVQCIIDGGTSVPTTGTKGTLLRIPYAATITGWELVGDASGSCQITVKKCSSAGFPTTSSIVASAQPKLNSAREANSTTLTGWTTAITANDWLEFVLDSVTTCKILTLHIYITRT